MTKLDEIVSELREADRQERMELIIDMAKRLPPLPERLVPLRDSAHQVHECQSPVFLFVEADGERVRLYADAPIEAPTVRGFVAMLVEGLDGVSAAEIESVPSDLVERSGMLEILGMQRQAGLAAVLRRLKAETARAVSTAPEPAEPQSPALDQAHLLDALRTVKDPELNLNIVDLGLVYAIQTSAPGQVDVDMTLTTPACPAGPEILRNAVTALEGVSGVKKANVRLVMSPPWSPDRMSDDARDELGIF